MSGAREVSTLTLTLSQAWEREKKNHFVLMRDQGLHPLPSLGEGRGEG